MKKITFTLMLCFTVSATVFAQSDKLKAKATEKVEQLNTEILEGDKTQALSEEQKAQIFQIHVERIMVARKAEKSGVSDEDKKAIQKKYFKKIYNDVLTKEQKKARNAGKGKSKK